MTIEEVDESLKQQTKRHEALKQIVKLIEDLRADHPDGADWIEEKLAE